MTDERRLEEIRERLAKITPGEWHVGTLYGAPSEPEELAVCAGGEEIAVVIANCGTRCRAHEADAQFIAHAKADIEYLLTRLERQRDFYERRMNSLQLYQLSLPEPYRTVICNIMANGAPYNLDGSLSSVSTSPQATPGEKLVSGWLEHFDINPGPLEIRRYAILGEMIDRLLPRVPTSPQATAGAVGGVDEERGGA